MFKRLILNIKEEWCYLFGHRKSVFYTKSNGIPAKLSICQRCGKEDIQYVNE